MSRRYSVRRGELSSAEVRRGLVPGWEVVCRDEGGSHVVSVHDSREHARGHARELRERQS